MLKIICLFYVIKSIWELILNGLQNQSLKQPLPKEVSDIYDEKRYKDFILYKKKYRNLSFIKMTIELICIFLILYSPFFHIVSKIQSIYISLFICILFFFIVDLILSLISEYYATFVIEEEFGMNKKTKREFFKDFLLDQIFELVFSFVIYTGIAFICKNISKWTNGFSISYIQSFMIVSGIGFCFYLIFILFYYLSFLLLKQQYHFEPLKDQYLLNQIQGLLKGCPKKVKDIMVYDESKKSTTKNAFVLKLPFYRMIGIADNFINDNSYNECLGVLAHEAGHLKHKKKVYNYIFYLSLGFIFLFIVWLLPNASMLYKGIQWIDVSFDLVHPVYYLYFYIVSLIMDPFFYILMVYKNYITRKEEYEADENVIKEGYQKELIQLFKNLSKDELVNVNPHPLIEFLEYDHPSMYHRIIALSKN